MVKKAKKNVSSNGNGSSPLYRLKGQDKIKEILTRYPGIDKPISQLASAFEVITPNDARAVSGYIQSRIASFCAERLAERDAFRKQRRRDKLDAEAEAMRSKLAELEALNNELGL